MIACLLACLHCTRTAHARTIHAYVRTYKQTNKQTILSTSAGTAMSSWAIAANMDLYAKAVEARGLN